MRGKNALWIFGVLIAVVCAIGALVSFNISFALIDSLPVDAYIYFIIAGGLAIVEVIIGLSHQTF